MPGLQERVWAPLKGRGLDAFVIHVGEGMRFATEAARDIGLTVPMLLDLDSSVNEGFTQTSAGQPPFPLTVLADRGGRVHSIVAGEELTPEAWRARIEPLLDE